MKCRTALTALFAIHLLAANAAPTPYVHSSTHKGDPVAEDVRARLIVGKKKAVIAWSGDTHAFTIDVPLKSSKPSDVPGFITIDKQIVQSTLVPVAKGIDLRNPTTEKEKSALLKYMNFELEYYKKKLKQNYTHLETEWVTYQNRLFLVWYFDLPENYKLVSRQVYVSTIFYDQVMDLNAPVFKSDDAGKARNLLLRLASAMKTYDHRMDLEALRKKL